MTPWGKLFNMHILLRHPRLMLLIAIYATKINKKNSVKYDVLLDTVVPRNANKQDECCQFFEITFSR